MASIVDCQTQPPHSAPWPLDAKSLEHSAAAVSEYGYSPALSHPVDAWGAGAATELQNSRALTSRPVFPNNTPSMLSFDSYQTDSESVAGAAAPPKTSSKASHAKLHKRSGSRTSVKGRKSDQSDRSVLSLVTRTDTPPMILEGAPYDAQSPSTGFKPRSKIKHNIRRLANREHEEDPTDVIDLSRSTAENEQRSGLGITSSVTKSAIDVDFTRNVRHGRSFSHTSQASTRSNPFKPSTAFVHPVYRSSSSEERSLPGSHSNSLASSYSGPFTALYPGDSYARTASSSSSIPQRPSLRIDTSSSSSGRMSNLSNLSRSIDGTPIAIRKRRDTAQSAETPVSRTSFDRAFSLRRGPSEPMDEMVRQASIQAARQAFADREEAKQRKHQEQERREKEREQRKEEKKEERARRKSESATRPSTATSEKSSAKDVVPKPRKAASKTPNMRSELPSVFTHDPPVSNKRRAKSVYVGALMWMKAKVNHVA